MSRTERLLIAIGTITAVELLIWIIVRSGGLAWHEWHRVAGLHWLAAAGMLGSLGTAVFIIWLLILMVRS
jgi:hypothetical protein